MILIKASLLDFEEIWTIGAKQEQETRTAGLLEERSVRINFDLRS